MGCEIAKLVGGGGVEYIGEEGVDAEANKEKCKEVDLD